MEIKHGAGKIVIISPQDKEGFINLIVSKYPTVIINGNNTKGDGEIIEGYPIEPKDKLVGFEGFTGIMSVYKALGFNENGKNQRNEILIRY